MAGNIRSGNEVGASTPSSDDSKWGAPVQGTDSEGNDVTASFGSGSKEGETLLSDGHKDSGSFIQSDSHDHYGSGDGINDNGTDRGAYTGEGSQSESKDNDSETTDSSTSDSSDSDTTDTADSESSADATGESSESDSSDSSDSSSSD